MKTVTLPYEEYQELAEGNQKLTAALREIESADNEGLILIENTHDIRRIRVTRGRPEIRKLLKAEFDAFESSMVELRAHEDRERKIRRGELLEEEDNKPATITKAHAIILYIVITGLILALIFS